MQPSLHPSNQQILRSGPSIWLSDQEVFLERLKANDPDAFKLLYKHYSAALLGMVLKRVGDVNKAEIILGKIFVDVWSFISTYDEDNVKIFTWLSQLAARHINGHLNRI